METGETIDVLHTLLPFVAVIFLIAVGVVLLNMHFQRNLLQQKLESELLKTEHQTNLLRNTIESQEAERKKIARDMHDELGSVLSIIKMQLMLMESRPPEAVRDDKLLVKTRELAETAIKSVRNISHLLLPPQLEAFGLAKTLEQVANQLHAQDAILVSLIYDDRLPLLPWPVSLGVYRVLMECISNTLRHAGARHIAITITMKDSLLYVEYTDDGRGLAPDIEHGLGLKNMYARITSLGGSLLVDNKHSGFRLVANIGLQ